MPFERFLRLMLILLLPASSLRPVSAGHRVQPETSVPQVVGPRISGPTQSLPTPVHNEATCAFCQAATFPPCTPTAVSMPAAILGMVQDEHVVTDTQVPHSTAHRLAESRAPPAFRIV
jgi:hypothetical protein